MSLPTSGYKKLVTSALVCILLTLLLTHSEESQPPGCELPNGEAQVKQQPGELEAANGQASGLGGALAPVKP